jgi:formiminoglutamase
MTLPIFVSVPHAGLRVPEAAQPYCVLTVEEVIADGDEGAAEIYPIEEHVAQFVTTDVARAIVDLNRAEDDFRPDGVIKTHTCWNVPVYDPFPPQEVVHELLRRYYRPYHETLSKPRTTVRLGVDCHTMAAVGPPIGPGAATARPHICLSDGNGTTLPGGWLTKLAECFGRAFDVDVAMNHPFRGGYITRRYGRQQPWVQVELSRAPFLTNDEKKSCLLRALDDFCRGVF